MLRKTIWLIVLAAISCGAFLGSRGLYQTTEGRYAEVAREMVETGDYLRPTHNYRPHWTKPPLTYWAIAGGIKIFGQNPWGVRMANLIFFVLTVLSVRAIAAALFDEETALLSGVIYATSPFAVFGASVAATDTPLALFETLLVLCYVKALYGSKDKKARRWMLGMWFFAGLAFLTKGPPAMLPLLPIIIWHYWHGERGERPRLFPITGLALFALVGSSWYVVISVMDPEVLSYWLREEVADRVGNRSSHHNSRWYRPFEIYLPVMLFGTGLWSYFQFRALARTGQWRPRAIRSQLTGGTKNGFLILWIAVPLVIFCLVNSRLPLYLLPLLSPMAILVARGVLVVEPRPFASRTVVAVAVISAMIFMGVRLVGHRVHHSKKDMASLYELGEPLGWDSHTVYGFEKPLSGLQFYLDGKLTRISFEAKERWAEMTVADALAQGGPWTFVCRTDREEALTPALDETGIPYRSVRDRYWVIFATSD